MKPIDFKYSNKIYGENQEEYLDLPAYEDDYKGGRVISCWKMSLVERFQALFTGKVWVHLLNFHETIPPMNLTIEHPWKSEVLNENS